MDQEINDKRRVEKRAGNIEVEIEVYQHEVIYEHLYIEMPQMEAIVVNDSVIR